MIVLVASLLIPLAPGTPYPDPPPDPAGRVSALPNHLTQGDGTRLVCANGYCWATNDSMPPTLVPA